MSNGRPYGDFRAPSGSPTGRFGSAGSDWPDGEEPGIVSSDGFGPTWLDEDAGRAWPGSGPGEGRGGAPSGPDRRAPASSEPPRTGPGRLAGGTAGRRAADEQSRPLYPSWDDD